MAKEQEMVEFETRDGQTRVWVLFTKRGYDAIGNLSESVRKEITDSMEVTVDDAIQRLISNVIETEKMKVSMEEYRNSPLYLAQG